jgi:hypothetical protein
LNASAGLTYSISGAEEAETSVLAAERESWSKRVDGLGRVLRTREI